MLKLHKQSKDEGLEVSYSDICYEACMAQNQMLEYAGGTPQLALTGQHPTGFTPEDLEYKEYTFTANELPSFKTFRIKFLMTSTNQAFVPRLTSLKVIATA